MVPSRGWNEITPVKMSGTTDDPMMAIVGNRPDSVSGGRYSGVNTQVFPGTVLEIAK